MKNDLFKKFVGLLSLLAVMTMAKLKWKGRIADTFNCQWLG